MATPSPVENLTQITECLIDLMERENAFLANMQPQDIRDLQEEKTRLAGAYERGMEYLRKNPALLTEVTPRDKERLSAATRKFQETLAENERALRAVKTVSERLLNVIVNTLAEKQSNPVYSAGGVFGSGRPGPMSTVSLAVNQRL